MRKFLVPVALAVAIAAGVSYAQRQNDQSYLESEKARMKARQQQSALLRDAQDRLLSSQTAASVIDCFRIHPWEHDGYTFMVDQCTGETWWFDDGYDFDYANPGEGGQTRPPKWRKLARDE